LADDYIRETKSSNFFPAGTVSRATSSDGSRGRREGGSEGRARCTRIFFASGVALVSTMRGKNPETTQCNRNPELKAESMKWNPYERTKGYVKNMTSS
jgi:hypothetical protein